MADARGVYMDMACAWRVHGMRMVYASGSGSRSAAALHWKWRVEAAALCGVEVAALMESRLQTHGAQAATPRVAGQAAREADPDPERNPNPEQDQLLVKLTLTLSVTLTLSRTSCS
jgi:hypothetical protein